jgi:hypothetical protein
MRVGNRVRLTQAALYAEERVKNCPLCSTMQSKAWRIATLHQREAECHRRARSFVRSLTSSNAALTIAPRYTAALRERGLAMLDAGRPAVAIRTFETLLRQERTFTMPPPPAATATATTAAAAAAARGEEAAEGGESPAAAQQGNPRTRDIFGLLLLAHGLSRRADEAAAAAAATASQQQALPPGTSDSNDDAADTPAARVIATVPAVGDDTSITLDQLIAAPPISLQYNKKRPPMVDHYAVLGLGEFDLS